MTSPQVAKRNQSGIGLVELLIVVAIAAILATTAVIGLNRSRQSSRLRNEINELAAHIEMARADAIRRHGSSYVDVTGPNTYDVFMDHNYTGTPVIRSYTLDENITFTRANGSALTAADYPNANFDWRGRATECTMFFYLSNNNGERFNVQVGGAGDVMVNSGISTVPSLSYTAVNQNAGVVSGAFLAGGGSPNNDTPCGASSSTAPPPPPPTGTGTNCSITLNTGMITVKKNGGSAGAVTATLSGTGTIIAIPDTNLAVTPATRTISTGTTSASFSITSKNKTRGTFPVKFNFSTCSPVTLYVKVIN